MRGRDLDDHEDRLRRSRSGCPDEEFDDGSRRTGRDDDDNFDDFDDRPARRRNWDDDERPRRRPASRSSPIPIAVGAVVVGVVGLMAAVGGYFIFESKPRPPVQPVPPVVAVQPQPAAPDLDGWAPVGPAPAPVEVEKADEAVISNLRLEAIGFGGRPALVFDCEFPGGDLRIGGIYVAVVTAPGERPAVAQLTGFMGAKWKVVLDPWDQLGGFSRGPSFPRGTSVYIAKDYFGPNSPKPKPVSNTLTLP